MLEMRVMMMRRRRRITILTSKSCKARVITIANE
jgi:hypothetical protein